MEIKNFLAHFLIMFVFVIALGLGFFSIISFITWSLPTVNLNLLFLGLVRVAFVVGIVWAILIAIT